MRAIAVGHDVPEVPARRRHSLCRMAVQVPTPTSPFATTPGVRQRMQAVRSRDTAPEVALRRQVWALGLRYRVDARPLAELRRKADMVFTRFRVAVFVDGCFWHACPEHGNRPAVNTGYWRPKLARNVERDAETNAALEAAGWTVVRVWEHEDPVVAAVRVAAAVADRVKQG